MAAFIAWSENGITRAVDGDELDALREAVEVLEGIPNPSRFELAYYKAEMEWYRARAIEAEEFEVHALEAVEVLEDQLEEATEARGYLNRETDMYYEANRKLSRENEYYKERADKLRERVKTYKTTLGHIAAFSDNSGARLARHVLYSRIDDGGSDF